MPLPLGIHVLRLVVSKVRSHIVFVIGRAMIHRCQTNTEAFVCLVLSGAANSGLTLEPHGLLSLCTMKTLHREYQDLEDLHNSLIIFRFLKLGLTDFLNTA